MNLMTSYRGKNRLHWAGPAMVLIFAAALVIIPYCAHAKAPKQRLFPTPLNAVEALVEAAKSNDTGGLVAILGPGSKDLVSSGDEVADRTNRESFVKQYAEKNRLEMVGDKKALLFVGDKDWPLPFPLIKRGKSWLFNTKLGHEEILNRRIGGNELDVMQVCLAYVDAQREYALKDLDKDGLYEYAAKFVSDPGKKDGLYWETREGEEPSPLGRFFAAARGEGYTRAMAGEKPEPYHGYYYRILLAQGKNAPGGEYNYVINGKMLGGFALVAYPAKYGNSGIMTFIVNQDGVVYQKNLGKNTEKMGLAMKLFDPDKTWTKVEPPPETRSAEGK
jgi:hypothetical protein